ncbi:MAG: hypothetical protein ACRYFS_02820 [Janthinobacterium lividum]
MTMVYFYIGAACLNDPKLFETARSLIQCEHDLLNELYSTKSPTSNIPVVLTYIVDTDGQLWVADRHSEHIACARGKSVLSAGEMTIEIDHKKVIVIDVTNQSTGYCPEPESWPVVDLVLNKAGIEHPNNFTRAFIFRLCDNCGQINVVKEYDFTCAVCGNELNQKWNFAHDAS